MIKNWEQNMTMTICTSLGLIPYTNFSFSIPTISRTWGAISIIWSVTGIRLDRKESQIDFFFLRKDLIFFKLAQHVLNHQLIIDKHHWCYIYVLPKREMLDTYPSFRTGSETQIFILVLTLHILPLIFLCWLKTMCFLWTQDRTHF